MAGQEQQSSRPREEEQDGADAPIPSPAFPQASAHTEGLDDLLDEIDGVLESNAEEFVRGFVQKGGQ
ncbi:MAG: ubiquitin-like protein Pup [Renibacterium salmoninarum]|nr:ubiquitin-like protein Pup [Renibacterium salmoninarum]